MILNRLPITTSKEEIFHEIFVASCESECHQIFFFMVFNRCIICWTFLWFEAICRWRLTVQSITKTSSLEVTYPLGVLLHIYTYTYTITSQEKWKKILDTEYLSIIKTKPNRKFQILLICVCWGIDGCCSCDMKTLLSVW